MARLSRLSLPGRLHHILQRGNNRQAVVLDDEDRALGASGAIVKIADPQALGLWLEVNGGRMQTGTTATMVYGVAFLVQYLSQFMTLEPGDIVTTGTPPGVGMGMKPPRFLRAGDVMVLGIDGLGQQRQRVVPA